MSLYITKGLSAPFMASEVGKPPMFCSRNSRITKNPKTDHFHTEWMKSFSASRLFLIYFPFSVSVFV